MASQTLTSENIGEVLAARLHGQVLTDEKSLSRNAVDQSIYEIRPLAVVVPQGAEDVAEVLRFAREEHIPITPRGGGSNTAGSALGRGIVLAFSRLGPLNRIVDFGDVDGQPTITVEPGLLHDQMQRFLRERGLFVPADPSSGAISLLGGNIATKASGPHAFKHGSIDRYLRHVQFVTLSGDYVDTADESTIPPRIREGILALRDDILADATTVRRLEARKDMKLASGYNLFTFIRHHTLGEFVAQLLVGSVGTLGVITQASLRAEPYAEGHAAMLLYFRSLQEAGDVVQHLKPLDVAAIEVMNYKSIQIIKERNPDVEMPDGEAHLLMIEVTGPERLEQLARVEQVIRERGYALAWPPQTVEGQAEQARLWKVRKALLPTLIGYSRELRPLSVVNDVGVEETQLADFIREVEGIFARHHLMAAIYGHAGSGNLHLRPLFDVRAPDLKAQVAAVADEVYAAVLRHGGTITGEHGMGRLRTRYLAAEWGPDIMGYMRRVKRIFDAEDLLNPEVMFSDRALTDDMKSFSRPEGRDAD
jgi:glycolate oxidase